MTAPAKIPAGSLVDGESFVDEVRSRPDALVYFLCNVGDGDAQVLLLPSGPTPHPRQVVIVDAGVVRKIPRLLRSLESEQLISLLPGREDPIALVVLTHPHQDHVGGMVEILEQFGELIAEFWDPGYYHAIPAYYHMMAAI
jgi:glyoxylase-like metal-dependent hydrolase (beta-lactamase superfamily II)